MLKDQLSRGSYGYLTSISNSEISIIEKDHYEIKNDIFEVDFYFREVSGFSESYKYEINLDHVKGKVTLNDATENQEVYVETDVDK